MLYQLSYLGLPPRREAKPKLAPYRGHSGGWQALQLRTCTASENAINGAFDRHYLVVMRSARRPHRRWHHQESRNCPSASVQDQHPHSVASKMDDKFRLSSRLSRSDIGVVLILCRIQTYEPVLYFNHGDKRMSLMTL
jgi:hypothetical protein